MIQNLLLGRVKTNGTTKVKEILDSISNNTERGNSTIKEYNAVIDTVNKFLSEMKLSRRKLSSNGMNTRLAVSALVKSFFDIKLGSPCPKCEADCPVELKFDATVPVCYECLAPGHAECFPDVKPEYGLLYICTSCSGMISPNIPPESSAVMPGDDVTGVTNDGSNGEVQDGTNPGDGGDIDVTGNGGRDNTGVTGRDTNNGNENSRKKNQDQLPKKGHPFNLLPQRGKKYDKTTPVCKFLRQGKCKFERQGKDCPAYHPPYCIKFFKWGSHERKGCSKGDKCLYYHPKPCKSVGKCKKKNCLLQHAKKIITPKLPPTQVHETTAKTPGTPELQVFLKLLDQLSASATKMFSSSIPGTQIQYVPVQEPIPVKEPEVKGMTVTWPMGTSAQPLVKTW